MAKLYSCTAVENLMNRYKDKGGEITEIEEGCLGYGFIILYGPGLKTAVVREVYLNEWSSAHKVRFYNKTPKKYERLIEEVTA